ncbi:hypothetical protein MMC25_001460 [Agyrium rufum]|nr:hypothetical protein [Agyrium rufum]
MSIHLSRSVLRCILHETPISHRQCVYIASSRWRRVAPRTSVDISGAPRRLFWGFNSKPARTIKDVDILPGYEEMLELDKAIRMNVRTPPPEKLATAFKKFVARLEQFPEALPDRQVADLTTTYIYLQSNENELQPRLSTKELVSTLNILLPSSSEVEKSNNEGKLQLGGLLYEDVEKRIEKQKQSDLVTEKTSAAELGPLAGRYYATLLATYGRPRESRDLLLRDWDQYQRIEQHHHKKLRMWSIVLKGFAEQQDEEGLLQTLDELKTRDWPFNPFMQQYIVNAFARSENLEAAKRWYERPIETEESPKLATKLAIMRLCIKKNNIKIGQGIFDSLLEEEEPTKTSFDMILQWSAAMGKGVDTIEQMMTVMKRRLENTEDGGPDIETINGLIHIANLRDDTYTAERYMSLAHKWRIEPSAQTYLLQMEYRIKVNDFDGAKQAYKELQGYDVTAKRDLPLINQLIQRLAAQSKPDTETIMQYVEDLIERKARFEPETIASLCSIHLERNEMLDVVDLLQTHVYHLGDEQRKNICDVFLRFILNRSNQTAYTWDAYDVMRNFFTDTDSATRLTIMDNFFERRRPDMATHVFGHMRQMAIMSQRPDRDAYVRCFLGIANSKHDEALQTVHNMLKLDAEVEPDTKLLNAIMMAYIACARPGRALSYWDEIVYSREGPSLSSIEIALQACENMTFGDKNARDIWNRLKKYDIEITPRIYAAYAAALAGQGLTEEVLAMANGMEAVVGRAPDALMIGMIWNATNGEQRQEEIQNWAESNLPEAWAELQKLGTRRLRTQRRVYKIKRGVTP